LDRVQTPGATPAQDAVFDAALVSRLKQFQLAQGLIPDSNLGPQTLIRLSGIGDATAPTLQTPAKVD
jgi:general secretion pathway protein A